MVTISRISKIYSAHLFFFLAAFLPISLSAASQEISNLAIGAKAPVFTLQDEAGKSHNLSDFAGKILVLEWLNPECPFVKRHAQEKTMKTLSEKHAAQDVKWLGINSTHWAKPEDNAKYKSSAALSYPILLDADGKVGKSFGAKTTPHIFIIDKAGMLAYKGAIDSDPGGELAAEKREKFVMQALEALVAGKPVQKTETQSYGCSVKYAE